MLIIGVDYHPSFQQIAFMDQETGEFGERRLNHSEGEAEKFYRDLKQRGVSVRVGMEATGYDDDTSGMRRAIAEFIEFYHHRGYHEGIGNVTPADVCYGRRGAILKRREEQKRATVEERFRYNPSRLNQTTMGALSLEP